MKKSKVTSRCSSALAFGYQPFINSDLVHRWDGDRGSLNFEVGRACIA